MTKTDTDIKIQTEQCRSCAYKWDTAWYKAGGPFCDHLGITGKRRDKGEGPGKCGSYKRRESDADH